MTNLTVKSGGLLTLPAELCERYGLTPATPIRILETRAGLLLIPLTDTPMSPELTSELAAWQQLSVRSWEAFPYEDEDK